MYIFLFAINHKCNFFLFSIDCNELKLVNRNIDHSAIWLFMFAEPVYAPSFQVLNALNRLLVSLDLNI